MSDPRLYFDADDHLVLDFSPANEDFREPVCPVCEKPIRWVLDMFSFTASARELAHARCVWTSDAFASEHHTGQVPA